MESESIEIGKKKLSELVSSRKSSASRALAQMKDSIAEARAEKIGFQSIADALRESGMKLTKYDVIKFCQTELGEKPKKARRRVLSKRDKPVQSSIAKSSFRVAGDDDL